MSGNALYYGDNLDILRRHIKDESIDLVYLDPPFNSNASYNVLFSAKKGQRWKRTQRHGNVSRNYGSICDTLLVFTRATSTHGINNRPNLHYPFTASNGVTYQPHPNG